MSERTQHYICMVSGGSDSVALLVSLCTQGLLDEINSQYIPVDRQRIHVLHINHMFRGQEADDDEQFVRELCQKLGVAVQFERLPVLQLMQEAGESNFEAYARWLRYQKAEELQLKLQKELCLAPEDITILTAHTADDRVETALMHLIEGTSLAGLTSLKQRRGHIYRPLLYKTRQELREFLQDRGYTWREDVTNADTRYFRAFVRHTIVPLAQERNPEFLASMARSLDTFQLEHEFLCEQAARAFESLIVERKDGVLVLRHPEFSQLHEAIQRRVALLALQAADPHARFETQHILAIIEALHRPGFSRSLAGGLELRHECGLIVLHTAQQESSGFAEFKLPVPSCVALGEQGRYLRARFVEVLPGADPIALAHSLSVPPEGAAQARPLVFDAELVGFSDEVLRQGKAILRVRPPRPGDRIEPFGMKGSKKVSDLLCEQKIPRHLRPFVPIVETEDGSDLVCIAGIRLNRKFACRKNSTRLVELSFKP